MNNYTTVIKRSKKCRGHYFTIYHATSQWIMRSDTHLELLLQHVKKPWIWSSKSLPLCKRHMYMYIMCTSTLNSKLSVLFMHVRWQLGNNRITRRIILIDWSNLFDVCLFSLHSLRPQFLANKYMKCLITSVSTCYRVVNL